MTTMIPRFFGVHQAVMRTGLWAEMRPSEQSLYVALMHESERRSTRKFKLKDAEVARLYGLAPRTLCNARKKLQEYRLILCLSGPGNVYTYTICDPETAWPYPGEPDKRVPYVKKADASGGRQCHAPMPAPKTQESPERPIVPMPPRTTTPPKTDSPASAYGLPGIFDNRRDSRF